MLINAFLLPEIWNKLSVLTTLKGRKTKIALKGSVVNRTCNSKKGSLAIT